MVTKSVAISGSVGKQVFAATVGNSVILRGFSISPLSATAYLRIRDGNASGATVIEMSAAANQSNWFEFPGMGIKFNNGMHVKLLGTGATCYLWID